MIQITQPPERGRFQYTTQDLTKFMSFKAKEEEHFLSTASRIITAITTGITAHQVIYLLQPKSKEGQHRHTWHVLAKNIQSTRRPIQHTTTVFTIKLLLDFFERKFTTSWSQYTKGAVSGLIGYVCSRPFDQIDYARSQIFKNQKKKLSRLQGIRVILQQEGMKGFYKNQSILSPICAGMYRSIYFGSWFKLKEKNPYKYGAIEFMVLPFVASCCASLVTLVPDKMRSFCWQIEYDRSRSLQKHFGKKNIELTPVSTLLMQYITSNQFKITHKDVLTVGYSVLTNGFILALFGIGQYCLEKSYQKQQN